MLYMISHVDTTYGLLEKREIVNLLLEQSNVMRITRTNTWSSNDACDTKDISSLKNIPKS